MSTFKQVITFRYRTACFSARAIRPDQSSAVPSSLDSGLFDLDVAVRVGDDFQLPRLAVQAGRAALFRRQLVRRRIAASAAGEPGLGSEVFELGDGLGQQPIALGPLRPQRGQAQPGHARRAELQEIATSDIAMFFEKPITVVHGVFSEGQLQPHFNSL